MKSSRIAINIGSIFLLVCLMNRQSYALKPSDFLCMNDPMSATGVPLNVIPAQTLQFAVKDCGPGKTKSFSDVCIVRTVCVYMSDELKDLMAKSAKTKYAEMTTGEKLHFIVSHRIQGLPTDLMCNPIKKAQGVLHCPPPEACKGDLIQGSMRPAIVDPELTEEILNSRYSGMPKAFHPKDFDEESKAGAAQ